MGQARRAIGFGLALALAAPAGAAQTPAARTETINKAYAAVSKDPATAVIQSDIIIADLDALVKPGTNYRCSPENAAAPAAPAGTVAIAIDYCDALFIKGFSLIDLNRASEAEPFLRRATELSPLNAHYLNEYAEWFKSVRQWQKSYDLFAQAADLAPVQPAEERDKRHARSLRGMGYAMIEMGKLDDAEMLMNQSLKLEPDSAGANQELAYIAEQRAKAGKQ